MSAPETKPAPAPVSTAVAPETEPAPAPVSDAVVPETEHVMDAITDTPFDMLPHELIMLILSMIMPFTRDAAAVVKVCKLFYNLYNDPYTRALRKRNFTPGHPPDTSNRNMRRCCLGDSMYRVSSDLFLSHYDAAAAYGKPAEGIPMIDWYCVWTAGDHPSNLYRLFNRAEKCPIRLLCIVSPSGHIITIYMETNLFLSMSPRDNIILPPGAFFMHDNDFFTATRPNDVNASWQITSVQPYWLPRRIEGGFVVETTTRLRHNLFANEGGSVLDRLEQNRAPPT